MQLPGLTDTDTWTLLNRLGVRGSEPAITGFFTPLGNHPLLVGIVAGLVSDYRTAPGDFDRWLGDPVAGGALSVPGLNLTQRRTHILAAALGAWSRARGGCSAGSQSSLAQSPGTRSRRSTRSSPRHPSQ